MTLILPKGYGDFNERLKLYDPRDPIVRRDWINGGNAPTQEYRPESEGKFKLCWKVDPHYCPDCGRKDITQEQQRNGSDGLFTFDEPMPEIDMKPGDAISYVRCQDCRIESIFEKKKGTLIYTRGDWDRARNKAQSRIQQNIIGWVKNRKLCGDTPLPWRNGR